MNCPARFCFFLRHKTFLNHGLDGAVHDGPVEAEKRGDLILIERNAAPERGQDEAAGRSAPGFSLKFFPDGKISRSDMGKDRVAEDILRNILLWNDDHKTFTVASRGLRH